MQSNGKRMDMLDCFRYLGVNLVTDGRKETQWGHRLDEAMEVAGTFKNVRKKRRVDT